MMSGAPCKGCCSSRENAPRLWPGGVCYPRTETFERTRVARYVSRYANDTRILRTDEQKLVYTKEGDVYPVQSRPALVAYFQPGLESTYERNFAIAAFTGKLQYNEDGTVSFGEYMMSPANFGQYAHRSMRLGGALPETTAHTVSIPNMTQILQIEGYDITQKMGTFDTENPFEQNWSREDKREAERLLDLNAGTDYFKVGRTKVQPPWPTFDDMLSQPGSHLAIPKQVRDMGFDPSMVLAYVETLDKPYEGLVKELTKLYEELVAEAQENDALQVEVR